MAWYFYVLAYIMVMWGIFIFCTKYFPNCYVAHNPDSGCNIFFTIIWPVSLIVICIALIGQGIYKLTKLIVNVLPDKKPPERKVQNF